MLKKRRRKIKSKKSHKNYFKKYRCKIYNKYQKAKIKNLEQSLEFQKYNVKEKKKKKKEKTNKHKQTNHKNYKENIGTKLITNTKKHKLKI